MAFLESPRFPDNISPGSKGGPGFSTAVVTMANGHEKRNANWLLPLHQYDVSYGIKHESDLYGLLEFFMSVQGQLTAFRYKDFADYKSCQPLETVKNNDQAIATGDGVTRTFQLIKTYKKGTAQLIRYIKKPVEGTVLVDVQPHAYPYVEPQWEVDYTTGIIHFTTAPGDDTTITAGFEFDVPVRFDTDELENTLESYRTGSARAPLIEVRL